MKSEISNVDVLVHPFYVARHGANIIDHDIYQSLIENWIKRLAMVTENNSLALVCFSHLSDFESAKNYPFVGYERSLIGPCLNKIPNRVIYINDSEHQRGYSLRDKLSENGLLISKPLIMRVYGETLNDDLGCVPFWGQLAKKQLGVENSNYEIDSEISMTFNRMVKIFTDCDVY